jgi:hypothetical protein
MVDKVKCDASIDFGFSQNTPVVPPDDALDGSLTDTLTFELVSAM